MNTKNNCIRRIRGLTGTKFKKRITQNANRRKIRGVYKMAEKIGTEKISREKGYLYFVGSDGCVWAVPMKHNTGGRKKKVGSTKVSKQSGYLYYVGNDGYVYKAKMNRGGRKGAKRKRKRGKKAKAKKKGKGKKRKR